MSVPSVRILLRAGISFLAIASVGCGGSDTVRGTNETAVRDSAGVRIVETSAAAVPAWMVTDSPEVEIGAVEGEAAYQFDRIVTAFRLDDGRVAVADEGSLELRYFGPDGGHLTSVGRLGSGPGEFRRFSSVMLVPGDSIFVHDRTGKRITVIGPGGEVARVIPTGGIPGMFNGYLFGRGGGDTLVMRNVVPFNLDAPSTYRRDSVLVTTTAVDATSAEPWLRLPSREWYMPVDPGPGRGGATYDHPFGYEAFVAFWNGLVVTGVNTSYELRVHDLAGRLRRIVRRVDAPPVSIEDGLLDAYLDGVEQRTSARFRAEAQERLESFPGDRTVPSYAELLPDDQDHLWVRDFVHPGSDEDPRPETWTVFDPEGFAVARATTPAGLEVLHISRDHIVGHARGELGVEYVRVYRLERGG